LHTGPRGVIASLWPVDDRATAALMQHFYEGFVHDGLSASAALRQAQLALAKDDRWRHPYYWAAFVLQGSWS
jgi:CHAT domain-containing protein